jgi:cystathionine gamma-synthase/O-acetylhomoserine (thiol)-lyase
MTTPRGRGTRAVHPPAPPPQAGAPLAPPIDLSSTYGFDDAEQFAAASKARTGHGYVYSRWANPTVDALGAAVAELEGAETAECFASGMGAIAAAFLALAGPTGKVVAARQLYGNTYSLLNERLPSYGMRVAFHDVWDLEAIAESLADGSLLYCETIGNPAVQVADLDALADLASQADVPLVVDNTFASPVLCRPIEHGASVVIHSATKYIGGHHDLMGGIVTGSSDTIEPIKAYARDMGPTMSPFTAFLALRGLQTMHLRVERACANAQRIAEVLADHPAIASVSYPTLVGDRSFDLAKRLLDSAGGAVVSFDVTGGRSKAARFQDRLELITPAASIGGTHSLVVHAASVTHTQLSDEELFAAGI